MLENRESMVLKMLVEKSDSSSRNKKSGYSKDCTL